MFTRDAVLLTTAIKALGKETEAESSQIPGQPVLHSLKSNKTTIKLFAQKTEREEIIYGIHYIIECVKELII